MKKHTEKTYYVYMVRCNDGSLYTGIAQNIERRIAAHNNLPTGARYTKARRPVVLVFHSKGSTKSEALKHELLIKRLTKAEKEAFIMDNCVQVR